MAQEKLKWILQSNLIKEEVVVEIKKALMLDHIDFEDVKIIPFSDELPPIRKPAILNVFYGSSTLILNAYKHPVFKHGVFFDPQNFLIQVYIEKWHDKVLNADSKITTFESFAREHHKDESQWFIRPNEDNKSFTGTVMSFGEVKAFADDLRLSNNPHLTTHTLVAISSPKKIKKEWRHFIVNRKVISSSRYVNNGELDISTTDVPVELIQFVEACCIIYQPHVIFVMDTALHDSKYYILECNCFNGTGFYNHDIVGIVRAVNRHLTQ
jgi:hypothetical protein